MIEFLSAGGVFGITLGYVVMFTMARFYFGRQLAKVSTAAPLKSYLFKPLPLVCLFLVAGIAGEHAIALKAVATTLCIMVMLQSAYKVGGLKGSIARQKLRGGFQ